MLVCVCAFCNLSEKVRQYKISKSLFEVQLFYDIIMDTYNTTADINKSVYLFFQLFTKINTTNDLWNLNKKWWV